MKKKLLFVIDSLGIGGAEKSLVTLLSLLDYNKFDVDLQLFAKGGSFEQFLPKDVNVLPVVHVTSFIAKFAFSLLLRLKNRNHAGIARVYWKTIGRSLAMNNCQYDVAIGYGQCVPTFYVIDKVRAKNKFVWVNCIFNLKGKEVSYQKRFYRDVDGISVVSKEALNHFKSVYPEFANKMHIIKDIYDANFIRQMALMRPEKQIDNSLPVIMTVGRLNKPQKGYDLALKAAKSLKAKGVKFRWYAIGDGTYRKEMESYISDNNLQDSFILLGSTPNPYTYMSQCDIYVQTSRFEGFGLTIAEARMLNKPIVCTNFEVSKMQIRNGENGLISSFDPDDIAAKIQLLLTDKALYNKIQQIQNKEIQGNTEELFEFYKLIEK